MTRRLSPPDPQIETQSRCRPPHHSPRLRAVLLQVAFYFISALQALEVLEHVQSATFRASITIGRECCSFPELVTTSTASPGHRVAFCTSLAKQLAEQAEILHPPYFPSTISRTMARIALPRGLSPRLISRRLSRNASSAQQARSFTVTCRRQGYEDTINNLKIGKHTRLLFQGFTGRQATANAKECIEYGTNVVGGVKPGVEGEHLGLPVLPSVRAAAEKLKPDASAIYVPGAGTVTAMEEAIEAEIPLIVAVAEHIPLHDLLRVMQMLKTQSKTRLVGANCPGIINTWGRCRIGFQPLPFFQEGRVGIVAKSGTLSYEVVASTTRAGLGQTYCISMGGDVVAGTNFVDAFKILEEDEKTEGIIMVGEVGGTAEIEAAEWIKDYKKRTSNPKPFAAIIGGINAPRGRIMGHAGAWSAPGEPGATSKMKVLESAGVHVVDHPEKVGEKMKQLLSDISGARRF